MATIAQITDFSQGYGRRSVIRGVSLSLSPGVTGLLGPNGAGKTTLLRVLSTVSPPQMGSLELFGEEVKKEKEVRRARRRIGYLPQDFGYYPAFSVGDFVRYCAWLREVPEKEAEEATSRAIAAVGLSDRVRDRMKSLSGGMLRRAGIAAAIVGDPDLVLLDEPTVGLDPAQRLEFRSLIRSLASKGSSVLLSTHLVEDVGVACDSVLVLQEGVIKYKGSPSDLVSVADEAAPGDSPLERGYMTILASTALNQGTTC